MATFRISGMACSHCKARVEKAISETEGVSSVTISLEDKTAEVEGTASAEAIIQAVKAAGYDCCEK